MEVALDGGEGIDDGKPVSRLAGLLEERLQAGVDARLPILWKNKYVAGEYRVRILVLCRWMSERTIRVP